MEHQPTEAVILPFRHRYTETIAGQVVHLGLLSDVELELLEDQCSDRVRMARDELTLVRGHRLGRLTRDEPGDAS